MVLYGYLSRLSAVFKPDAYISVFFVFSLVFPVRTRTDYGVEVSILAQCQIFLRRQHLDVFAFDNAHYNGRSELNQVRLL